jgi:HEAT repeat protein
MRVELWDSGVQQARIWKTSLCLGAVDPGVRLKAIEVLSQAGAAAIPCLRFHLLREYAPRVQFAAAVALHRLNMPAGMETLLKGLDLSPAVPMDLAPLVEEAFLMVGSPAAKALLELWPTLPAWRNHASVPPDTDRRLQLICRIWAGLRDPIVLETLFAYATRIPELLPPTVAAFGQMAIRKLREAAQSADPMQRLLVVRTLERIPGEPSFQTLAALLRDPDPQVRFEACRALAQVGSSQAASEAVAKAVQAGYSTEAAVQLLATTGHPLLYHLVLQVIERAASLYYSTHDTNAAVHVSLDLLMQAPWSSESLLGIVCTLLEKPVPTAIVLAGVAHVTALQAHCPGQKARTQGLLWNLLADLNPEVRTRAAQALLTGGDPTGRRFLELLAECRPQGSFLEKLTTLLRGGPDASQAATQAVQQVQQWVTHMSREAVGRLSAPAQVRESSPTNVLRDPRVPALARKLLNSALRSLSTTYSVEETEEALALCVTAIRALRRVAMPAALSAQTELICALTTRKQLMSTELFYREIAEPVREEAALALIEFLGPESFGIFMTALGTPQPEVQGTAILALGRLGDARAVASLQPIASNPDNMLAPHAIQALAVIRQNNPEMMTLLRGSSQQDSQPETLLRPLPFSRPDAAPELLLRPASNGDTTP